MANVFYPIWKRDLMQGTANTSLTGTVKAALIANTYTFSAAHQFWSSASGSVNGTPVALASKTFNTPADGVFDAADVTWTAPPASITDNAVILYIDTGVAGTSYLVCYLDTATGLSLVSNGADINGVWDNGANRIFKL